MHLTIGKFAEAGGVGVETVRYYQRKGLLETPQKSGGIRHYNQEDLRHLKFIRKAKTAGFTLQEIKELIALDSSNDRARAQQLAKQRIQALDTKIGELEQARKSLKQLADECSDASVGPCPILESFTV